MSYKFTIEDVMKRQEDGIDTSIIIVVKCENDVTHTAIDATIVAGKSAFAKWLPMQAEIKAYAKSYLQANDGAVINAMKEKTKTLSDSSIGFGKIELDVAVEDVK